MKTLLLLATLAISLQAQATSIVVGQKASVYSVTGLETPFGEKYVSGEIRLDYLKDKLRLVLVGKNPCPAGAFCFRGPHFERIELPIVERSHDVCNRNIYKAEIDKLPVDGAKTTITIIDNSSLTCRIRPMAPTVIKYEKSIYDRLNGTGLNTVKATILATPLRVSSPLNF